MLLLTVVCRLKVVRSVLALPFCAIAVVDAIMISAVKMRFI
jgi:hypothetical protein